MKNNLQDQDKDRNQNAPTNPVIVGHPKNEGPAYRIPEAPKSVHMVNHWVPPGELITIFGYEIKCGMLYVTTDQTLQDIHRSSIDTKKLVSSDKISCTDTLISCLPSYAEMSPNARSAYLGWLADGKMNPEAQIAYVFLYFYGLERRLLIDAATDPMAAKETPLIIDEIKRLLSIYAPNSLRGYGGYSSSASIFEEYATELIEFIEISTVSQTLYYEPVPEFVKSYELPFHFRLAIGQAARDRVPLTADWVFAWINLDSRIYKKTPIIRCKDEFFKLFMFKFKELYPKGFKLTANRTMLKLVYQPASSELRKIDGFEHNLSNIPDISILSSPIKKLQAIVDLCSSELNSYSRYLTKNPDKASTLEAILKLPTVLWPNHVIDTFQSYKVRALDGLCVETFTSLIQAFNGESASKQNVQNLAKAFEAMNVFMEPDVLNNSRAIKAENTVILFYSETNAPELRNLPSYLTSVLTLELASCVAAADGCVSEAEIAHLNDHIDTWLHLLPENRTRLKAQLKLLQIAPASLSTLKKKLSLLDISSKSMMIAFITALIQVRGQVTAEKVKLLEKMYKLLSFDPKKVYGDIHLAVTTDKLSVPNTSRTEFILDAARIQTLQQDTAKVGELLAEIFNESPANIHIHIDSQAVAQPDDEDNATLKNHHLLGLDENHSWFARTLMSRLIWSRPEIDQLALDLQLMPDGALERINEAAFDAFDMPFTEGDNPIEINPELIGKINA